MRHRLAFAQAKNPKANIVSADVMSKVSVGHNLSVTSDKPTFMAIDTTKGTFREHKGKLTNTELDKFVRQVESGHLNMVRKLHFNKFDRFAHMVTSNGYNQIGTVFSLDGEPLGFSRKRLSREDGKAIAKLILSNVIYGSITINGVEYSAEFRYNDGAYFLQNETSGGTIVKTRKHILVGLSDESSNLEDGRSAVKITAEFMRNMDN